MFDLLSTQFSEVQREIHRGIIGQQEYDRRTYDVLYGDGSGQATLRPRRERLVAVATALFVLGGIAVALWWAVAL
jgi:hypothetical protein